MIPFIGGGRINAARRNQVKRTAQA